MVEMIIAAALLTCAVMAVTSSVPDLPRRGRMAGSAPDWATTGFARDAETDLPCPWCRAATGETDVRCSSCGQPFG